MNTEMFRLRTKIMRKFIW